jgi:oligoribonuclease NrnB/cAMP/cGMP phosphodiesterase (DHH superfamily)
MAKIRQMHASTMAQIEPVWWIISDLNLTADECVQVETLAVEAMGAGISVKINLLDHHLSGKDASEKFGWYFLDNDRCATKITRDFFANEYKKELPTELITLTDAINAVDLWHEEDALFEFGKVLMRVITETKEIPQLMFPNERSAYRISALKKAAEYLKESSGHIKLDDSIHFIKKSYLTIENNDTIDNLASKKVTSLIEKNLDRYTIAYGDTLGVLTMGLNNVSVIANAILEHNPSRKFVIEYTGKGSVSFRASGEMDVCAMAQKIANGGGHKNASGGKLALGREFFVYEDARNALQNYINQKLGLSSGN